MSIIKKLRAWNINRKQSDLNKEFKLYGMSEGLLEKQIELNMKRHEHDIPDKNQLNDEGYSQ